MVFDELFDDLDREEKNQPQEITEEDIAQGQENIEDLLARSYQIRELYSNLVKDK